jgi:hypothetical protein
MQSFSRGKLKSLRRQALLATLIGCFYGRR